MIAVYTGWNKSLSDQLSPGSAKWDHGVDALRKWAYVTGMTIQLKPDQERIINEQLATGRYRSVEEVLDSALATLPHDAQPDPNARREAVRRMLEFGQRHHLSLGEPITREFLHEGHRI